MTVLSVRDRCLLFPGLDLPVIEACKDGYVAIVLVLGAQGAFGFNACMNWIGEQGELDADLMEIDWMTWIQQLQDGTLSLETALRAIVPVQGQDASYDEGRDPSGSGSAEMADLARQFGS